MSPGYFDVFRIPLLRGRDFTDRDGGGAAGVVIINQTMARQFWPKAIRCAISCRSDRAWVPVSSRAHGRSSASSAMCATTA